MAAKECHSDYFSNTHNIKKTTVFHELSESPSLPTVTLRERALSGVSLKVVLSGVLEHHVLVVRLVLALRLD